MQLRGGVTRNKIAATEGLLELSEFSKKTQQPLCVTNNLIYMLQSLKLFLLSESIQKLI